MSEWPSHDAAFNEVAAAIERTIDNLQQQQRRRAGEKAQEQTQEARKRTEAKARRAVEEKKQDALRRREQDEARRAAEAEATRMSTMARYSDARGRRRLKWIAVVALAWIMHRGWRV